MSTTLKYPHLSIDDDGTARFAGTRYKVIHLAAEHYHYDGSAEVLMCQHPHLRPAQVYAALTYFYDHHDQIVAQMQREAEQADADRARQSISRAELLERRQRQK